MNDQEQENIDVRIARMMGCDPRYHPPRKEGFFGSGEWWECTCEHKIHNVRHEGNSYGTLEPYSSSGDGLMDMLGYAESELMEPALEWKPSPPDYPWQASCLRLGAPYRTWHAQKTPGLALAHAILWARGAA